MIYAASGPTIFGVQKYARSLAKVVQRKNIDTMFRHNLIAVDA